MAGSSLRGLTLPAVVAVLASLALVAPTVAVAAPLVTQAAIGSAPPRGVEGSCPDGHFPEDGFVDVPSASVHEMAIDCLVWWRVANGRNSAYYAPASGVTREAMASFIARAVNLDLAQPVPDAFSDDTHSVHQQAINHLAHAGVVSGTGEGRYSPARVVTRSQMARFIVNAAQYVLGAPLSASQDYFDDDAGHLFESDINKSAELGIAAGRSGRTYDPAGTVSREQMASFLSRLLDVFVESGKRQPPAAQSVPRDPGDDVNCGDFLTRADAQARYDHYYPHYGDNAGLDPDGDRYACDGPTSCPSPPSGEVSDEVASRCLYEAWAYGDMAMAHPYASQDAINWFDFPYDGYPWDWEGCEEAMIAPGGRSCYWYIPDPDPSFHGVLVEMFLGRDDAGHFVSSIESYG